MKKLAESLWARTRAVAALFDYGLVAWMNDHDKYSLDWIRRSDSCDDSQFLIEHEWTTPERLEKFCNEAERRIKSFAEGLK